MNDDPLRRAAEVARDLVTGAGALVFEMQGRVRARDKGGGLGPVTEADLASERMLLEGLGREFPGDAVLAEETRQSVDEEGGRIWCVDPLDGTREYSQGLPEFAVHAGLLVDGEPVAGAFALPADGIVFWGWRGGGAFMDGRPLRLETCDDLAQAVAIHSRSRTGPLLKSALQRLAPASTIPAGSVGYKVGQILLGRAHLYLHAKRGTTWWDTVAPAAVFRAAGGEVADKVGRPLRWADGIEHRDGFLFTVPGLARPAAERLLD